MLERLSPLIYARMSATLAKNSREDTDCRWLTHDGSIALPVHLFGVALASFSPFLNIVVRYEHIPQGVTTGFPLCSPVVVN